MKSHSALILSLIAIASRHLRSRANSPTAASSRLRSSAAISSWRARCTAKPSTPIAQRPKNAAVLWNKIGIAYHQLGDLNGAARLRARHQTR